jgi:DNA topoisomerase-1
MNRRKQPLPVDHVKSAVAAGLVYIHQHCDGIARKRAGTGFVYIDCDGKRVTDRQVLARIRSLVIPPAWSNVWICANPDGHLQALGTDVRGRRQYRYHPRYREIRNATKFSRMIEFAKVLPDIRARVQHDLSLPGLPRDKVLATVVRLLETTFIRVGNDEYARENESFGLTTLRNRHVEIEGSSLRFHFRGKSGQDHEVEIRDRRLARIVKACHDLPGYELFQYVDEAGARHAIGSADVNGYLKEASGADFTAKDFRTWAGSVQSALELAKIGPAQSAAEAKRNPAVLQLYEEGTLHQYVRPVDESSHDADCTGVYPEEECVLRLIRKHSSAMTAQSSSGAAA